MYVIGNKTFALGNENAFFFLLVSATVGLCQISLSLSLWPHTATICPSFQSPKTELRLHGN